MAHGFELVLGWPYKDWSRFTGVLQLPPVQIYEDDLYGCGELYQNEDGEEVPYLENIREFLDPVFDSVVQQLRESHTAALKELGFNIQSQERQYGLDCTTATTSLGERQFAPWVIELFYDTEEGDLPEYAVIGVAVTGRYKPTFLDWQDSSGTMSPMIFDPEVLRQMEIAKKHIVEVIPCLRDAPWIIIEKHY